MAGKNRKCPQKSPITGSLAKPMHFVETLETIKFLQTKSHHKTTDP